MKKLINRNGALAILASSIFLFSCKKVLEVSPYDSLTDATAFSTAARVDLTMNGVYDAAQSGFYNGSYVNNRGYPFGAASIQQGDMRGEDIATQQTFYQITNEATYTPTTLNNTQMWGNLYGLINKANLTIEGLNGASSKGVITATVATQYIAECRFLRALAMHEALTHFARPYADGNGSQLGIVIRDFGINSDATVDRAKAIPRSSVADCYTYLLNDLDFAETNLSSTKNTFRATKSAAIALKMRVKMHKQDWPGVILEGAKIVSATPSFKSTFGDSLTTTTAGAFGTAASPVVSTSENTFSIRNDATDNPGTNAALARMWGRPSSRGVCVVSPIIYNLPTWRCDDLRRSLLLVQSGQYYYTGKYVDYTNWSDAAPIIRYAEVLITLAEAEARNAAGTTVSARAVDLLNAVRNRNVPALAFFTVASFANKNALLQAILDERRIEFLAEGKRWGDIHRLALDPVFTTSGIPAKMSAISGTALVLGSYSCTNSVSLVKGIGSIPYADNRFIWPIPLDEIQQNPIIAQNPGY